MTYTTLTTEHRGRAAWVWMNRPELHNAFDETLIAELKAIPSSSERTASETACGSIWAARR
jgi:enoyl-CoA hydratase/carnithine racemase